MEQKMRAIWTQYFSVLFLILINTNCNNAQVSFVNPERLFTNDELNELYAIVEKFDSVLLKSFDVVSVKKAYMTFAIKTLENAEQGQGVIKYDEILTIYQQVEEYDIAKEIWWSNQSTHYGTTGININMNGKYLAYLKAVGEFYPFIYEYTRELELHQDLGSAQILSAFASNSIDFNFTDINIRLIFAIHYLTFYNL